VPSFDQLPNPEIQPEKSNGWDVGVSEDFSDGKATVDVTYFRNHYKNLFQWQYLDPTENPEDEDPFAGHTVNIARATTDGVEVSISAQLAPQWKLRGAYTYLDATDDTAGQRLGRRPRNVADADVIFQANAVWTIGVGVHWVADQVDGVGEFPDYTTARVFTSWAVRKDWLIKLRLENALDRHYEEVRGYPALPFGAYGSVEWKF